MNHSARDWPYRKLSPSLANKALWPLSSGYDFPGESIEVLPPFEKARAEARLEPET
jgi:hypothetical protein